MSEVAQEWEDIQHAALAELADALARFGNAVEACKVAGLPLAEALTVCGVPVPGWAGPMLEVSLGSLAPEPRPGPQYDPLNPADAVVDH